MPLQASVEAFDHAIGLRRFGLGQPGLDTRALAQRVEFMLARGLSGTPAEQPVSELFAVVRQQGANLDGLALCTAFRNDLAAAAVLRLLMAMNTQRVALSMATNTWRLAGSSARCGR